MSGTPFDDKVRSVFGDFAIDKGLLKRLGVSGDDRYIPSYVMDWIVTYKSKAGITTAKLQSEVRQFIEKHLPAKGDKERVKFKLSQGEVLTILDAISVQVKLEDEPQYFASIPCLDETRAKIEASIIRMNEGLLQGSTWGAIRLRHDEEGGIRIVDFRPMQTGRISLDAYCEARHTFSLEEWIDLLIRTMGYEPATYSEQEKVWMLCRLIPVVHNRVNMMELAPPGSGKSYVYNNVSRHVWLTAAEITPAVLFYNRANARPGLLTRFDLLVLDEAQSIRFSNAAEIQAQLKGYLEQGVFARGDCCATAECGFMLLANIDLHEDPERTYANGKPRFVPANRDYIRKLPHLFLESPLLDRFHGIIPGWEIPPFETDQQAAGYGLKADYFAEVCHALRAGSPSVPNVRGQLGLSGYKRDCTAIERLAGGLAKLLLIDSEHPRFEEIVVRTAFELRRQVRSQLNALDCHGYPPTLQVRRLTGSEGIRNSLGRILHYELLEEIGRGGMARVYKGLDTRTGSLVAVKKVATEGAAQDEAAMRREIDIYSRLQEIVNPHILGVKHVFRERDTYALVTEYAEGGSLWELMGGDAVSDDARPALDEATTKAIALALADGITALHDNDIVHRDIKPQNILRCDDVWKIADFGISKLISNPVSGYTFQGAHSLPWAPAEQIEGALAHPSADIYALARVLAFLLTGSQKKSDIGKLPCHWAAILAPCLDDDPAKRPDIDHLQPQIEALAV